MQLHTLKKRSEFQRVRGGGRYACAAFVLEGKPRPTTHASDPLPDIGEYHQARFGFTITKKIGNAVVRNRIRRRLRAALSQLASTSANPAIDYVVIARLPAHTQPFAELLANLQTAFRQVHAGKPGRPHSAAPNSATARKSKKV